MIIYQIILRPKLFGICYKLENSAQKLKMKMELYNNFLLFHLSQWIIMDYLLFPRGIILPEI